MEFYWPKLYPCIGFLWILLHSSFLAVSPCSNWLLLLPCVKETFLRSWRRESYGICPLLLSLFCRICPAVVMRTMVPVLPMTDQPQGEHSEPSQPFRPRTLIQICTPGGARWSHQSIRAAFQRCSQQRRREIMNGTQLLTWKLPPSCWATVARWTDGSQPISHGEILSIVLTGNMLGKTVLPARAWRKLIGWFRLKVTGNGVLGRAERGVGGGMWMRFLLLLSGPFPGHSQIG